MSMRISRRNLLATGAALSILPKLAMAQEKITLKLGTLGSTEYFYYKGAKQLSDEAAKRSNGRLEIQVFANQQLGNERDMIEGMQLGTIDMAVINTPLLTSFESRFMLFDMPFMFNDWAHVNKVLTSKIGQDLMQSVEAKNLKAFAFSTAGFRHVVNYKQPIVKPDDLKGMKIRTLDNPVHVAIMNAMGGNATPMQYSEVAAALRQHTVDGIDAPSAQVVTEKFYETQKFYSLTGHVFTPVIYLMSMKRYKSLPADMQKVIADCAKIGADFETKSFNDYDEQAIKDLQDKYGMKVNQADKPAFRARMQPVFDRFQDRVGKDLIEQVRKMGA
jgi:tripartite ATP-independent transporter DctP family solute receptor